MRRHLPRPGRRIALVILIVSGAAAAQDFRPDIPRAWDDQAVEDLELPLVQRDRSPRYLKAQEYYQLKVRPIYRSYPIYVQGKEPPGYIESLQQREPEILFDPAKLHTREDWIRAGKLVFEAEVVYAPARLTPGGRKVPPSFAPWVSSDGILAGFKSRYVIRKKGVIETGSTSCATCHSRLMPDGTFLEGAQGNFPDGVFTDFPSSPTPNTRVLDFLWTNFGAPWIQTRESFDRAMTSLGHADPYGGVLSRQGTSAAHPPHIPSLIGVHDIQYLDATGLVRHRSIGDLMRYAVLNTGLDTLARFGDFQPAISQTASGFGGEDGTRYSDEQLYAMALYLYSLRPPANPNPTDERSRRGEQVFQREGCAVCHTPPLYTANKVTPATGFRVPDDLRKSVDILAVSVGTDPALAMQTRRGTGFYKIPSLRGVWFRNGFGHAGAADTLDEWLDPERLKQDYVPKGYHRGPGPIQGHEFGLKLLQGDKQALIAFLKTL
jgi:cytochrome c553